MVSLLLFWWGILFAVWGRLYDCLLSVHFSGIFGVNVLFTFHKCSLFFLTFYGCGFFLSTAFFWCKDKHPSALIAYYSSFPIGQFSCNSRSPLVSPKGGVMFLSSLQFKSIGRSFYNRLFLLPRLPIVPFWCFDIFISFPTTFYQDTNIY